LDTAGANERRGLLPRSDAVIVRRVWRNEVAGYSPANDKASSCQASDRSTASRCLRANL